MNSVCGGAFSTGLNALTFEYWVCWAVLYLYLRSDNLLADTFSIVSEFLSLIGVEMNLAGLFLSVEF